MKYAIITGASTGIGREVSIELAKNDFIVGLVGRNKKGLNETKKIIENGSGKVELFLCDLSNRKIVDELIRKVKKKLDRIDLIANIAGIWHGEKEVFSGIKYADFKEEILLQTMEVGIITPMILINKLLPLMKNGGDIINLSGTFENGAKGWVPYYVSKRAIEDFTIALADDLKGKK